MRASRVLPPERGLCLLKVPMAEPRVAICVPARNEAALLPALLDSVAALDLGGVDAVVCIHLDSCDDSSAALLSGAALRLPISLHVGHGRQEQPNAGRARGAAMALGLATLGDRPDALLLSTDADSRPRRDWVQAAVHALTLSDVAAGRVVSDAGGLQARVERYYDRLHAYRRAIDPVPWEPVNGTHHGGAANLAMRASTYGALGGFAWLPAGEDARLLDDAARAGFRVRRDPAMVVETSARRRGRAPGGLADALRALDVTGLPKLQHPDAAAWQYGRHAAARAAFGGDLRPLATLIGVPVAQLDEVARDCPNAESFATRAVPAAPDADRRVSLPDAERALDELERSQELSRCRGAA